MTAVRLDQLTKRFAETTAVAEVSLAIAPGELFFLLGPSGCGKSTLLRMIAGLLQPTAGTIHFNDRDVTSLPTEQRNAVMCFQSYALWPHMSVRENIRFGLKVRRLDLAEQNRRIEEVARLVQLEKYLERKPNELSGGQQQRVALARAMAVRPDCLLLDEPLSNLDAALRQEMRSEIRRICKTAGLTAIYVTHDQKEALSVADRIGVMKDGRMMQVGKPEELYHAPANAFIASFVGATNLIAATVRAIDSDIATVETPIGILRAKAHGSAVGSRVTLSIRPEHLRIGAGPNHITAQLISSSFLGESSEHMLCVNDQKLKMISSPPRLNLPSEVSIEFDPHDAILLPE